MLRRTQSNAMTMEEAPGEDLRAANERLLATGGLRRRAQPSPVDLMREALDEPEDEIPDEPAFVAAPAIPIEETAPQFVVKPSEGRGGRRGMDELREQALRNVIASAADGGFAASRPAKQIRRPGAGMSPSRIILIAVALIAGGLAAFVASQVGQPAPAPEQVVAEPVVAPTVEVLVAKEPIAIGDRVTAATVGWTEWPETALHEEYLTSANAPEAITELEGSVARSEILPGEPVLQKKLAAPGGGYLASVLETGMRGVSVPVAAASASGGFIQPNDRVDVVSTRTFQDKRVTETILRNVRVLAINGRLGDKPAAEGKDADTDASGTENGNESVLATLELDTPQAELVINSMAEGELTLVLRPFTEALDGATDEEAAANLAIRASSPFWSK